MNLLYLYQAFGGTIAGILVLVDINKAIIFVGCCLPVLFCFWFFGGELE